MQPRDVVLRFLRSIGRPAEAELYLSLFRSASPESFAIISVADSVIREFSDALLVDLRFLSQLGLTPVIVFGIDEPSVARASAREVAEGLEAEGVPHRVVDADDPGAEIRAAAATGELPLVPLRAPGTSIDTRFDVLAACAAQLRSRKIVLLGRRSGLQPTDGPIPSLVDLTREYDALRAALPPSQATLLTQSRRIIETVAAHSPAHRLTIAVTSPLDLLRELFTVRGAGTLIRRGSIVTEHVGFDGVDLPRLRALIDAAFGRRLDEAFFTRPPSATLIADDYRGAAIVVDTEQGPYLSKFAVDQAARGEGIGRDLWLALGRAHPSLFWRSRRGNPIASWYVEQCDGMYRGPEWVVFWRSLPPERIPAVIAHALATPVDWTT